MLHLRSLITGAGSYLPPRVVTNAELAKKFNTTDEWIREKIGIRERRYVDKGVGTSDLALEASKKALEAAEKKPADVDCIIFATSTPDYFAPGSGVLLQKKLGCRKIPAFDIRNTSPGFLFSLELADSMIRIGKYQCILVIAAEVHSTGLDFSDRGRMMSVIFGDGAGAVVLEPTEGNHGILTTRLRSDGTYYDKLWCEAPASLYHPRIAPTMIEEGKVYPTMDGKFVFENAVQLMSLVSQEVLVEQNLTVDQIQHVIPHQANLRIIEAIAERMQIPMEKVHHNIETRGNTNSATIPILLDETLRAGKIAEGDLILMMSFGSGFSWGAGLMRW
ncbi:MAG: ketoacyl-ACP synthase III [Deltaproteobacteria bacterium]|nr:ketoacyl-ACP synthase III [Deltaproteobacteria bacterium]